jgi:hypothetical protein
MLPAKLGDSTETILLYDSHFEGVIKGTMTLMLHIIHHNDTQHNDTQLLI